MAHLPIDLTRMCEHELIALNHKIVERLRFLRDSKAHHQMQELKLGDRVSFESEAGRKIVGTILRLNRKSVSLIDSDGIQWRVSPALVSRVETKDVDIEVAPAKPSAPSSSSIMPGLRTFPLFQTSPSEEIPRNAPCPCGSGKKHKRCCLLKYAAGNR
jgi:hypothetical protein